jgi:hypothetical protein
MAVLLTKPSIPDSLPNQVTVKCPRCADSYRLSYSDDEWNKVKDWLAVAERALREDHKGRHEATSIVLVRKVSSRTKR